mgnify:CR=1 FL=1
MSIASEVERIAQGKALVAAAVTEKGVETPAGATFQQIAENVAAIESGGNKTVKYNFLILSGAEGDIVYCRTSLTDIVLTSVIGTGRPGTTFTIDVLENSMIVSSVEFANQKPDYTLYNNTYIYIANIAK